ncbi:Potassium channel GORK [Phytophthora cinnamomi]|uniref:Potassium channel GORK n=1 Tax=Phytophthora cinnamomi TaxID=4785 RepID=UPI00355A6C05|nr:Potassium channel GORK [Phytophthora cinnamomi]
MSLPSVVLRHVAANSEDKKQRARNEFGSTAVVSGKDATAPPESPTRMTRQQRKAARAFANLQYPVAAKCLGDCVQMSVKATIADTLTTDQTMQTTSDDLLFLFPTVTKRRQLHGKTLPLLPQYRGYDVVPAE